MSARMLLLLSVLAASCGQILFKKGMMVIGAQNLTSNIWGLAKTILNMVFTPYVFTGLVLYTLSTVMWLFALSKAPLNYVYPFTALGFVLIMAASCFMFSEAFPLNRIVGLVVICAGFIISSYK